MFARAGAIVARPRATWPAVARERTPVLRLYAGYIVPLAAIGPCATFVALHVIGVRISRVEFYRASVGDAFAQAAFSFAYALAGVALIAAMLSLLAPLFGATRDFGRALRVAAYAYTPAWLAGVLLVFPPLRVLQLGALAYALYLLALGARAVLAVSPRAAFAYAAGAVAVRDLRGFRTRSARAPPCARSLRRSRRPAERGSPSGARVI